MPVYKDEKRGTWYIKFRIKDPITGKLVQKLKRGFPTKREAKIAEGEMLKSSATGGSVTFHQMSDQYNSYMQYSPEMARKHTVRFEKSFPYYEHQINKITRPMLVAWQKELFDTDYSTKTKSDTIAFVKAVFRYANKIFNISDPSDILKAPKKTAEDKLEGMHVWTIEQFNQFIQHVEGEYYRIFFITLFWTGARRGEILALQKTDLQGDELSITKTIKHAKGGFKPPKTGKPRRIKIDSQTLAEIQKCMSLPGPFIFGGDGPLSISSVQRKFTEAVKASGVEPIRIHDLRHSHATILINSGVNIVAVSRRLGHTDVNMTLRTYTHLLQATEETMMNKIEELRKV